MLKLFGLRVFGLGVAGLRMFWWRMIGKYVTGLRVLGWWVVWLKWLKAAVMRRFDCQ